jgi:hypothetical protein
VSEATSRVLEMRKYSKELLNGILCALVVGSGMTLDDANVWKCRICVLRHVTNQVDGSFAIRISLVHIGTLWTNWPKSYQ